MADVIILFACGLLMVTAAVAYVIAAGAVRRRRAAAAADRPRELEEQLADINRYIRDIDNAGSAEMLRDLEKHRKEKENP